MLLPTAEFALNSTCSASTGHSPSFVLYGREPVLLFEHAVHTLVDVKTASLANHVHSMWNVITQVRMSMA